MSRGAALILVALQLLALLVGTQMPGAWRAAVERSLHSPFPLSSLAHFVLFAGLTLVLLVKPLAWPTRRVLLTALFLAALTECLQFLAIDRHPRLVDICIDMAGSLIAWRLVKGVKKCITRP